MSFTLGNGWDPAGCYFSLRGYRGIGQRLHCGSRKWRAYDLPEGRVAFMSRPCGGLRSWRRGLYRPSVEEARRRRFYRAMDRNPLYYANIADRPAGALRFGYPYGRNACGSSRRDKSATRHTNALKNTAFTL